MAFSAKCLVLEKVKFSPGKTFLNAGTMMRTGLHVSWTQNQFFNMYVITKLHWFLSRYNYYFIGGGDRYDLIFCFKYSVISRKLNLLAENFIEKIPENKYNDMYSPAKRRLRGPIKDVRKEVYKNNSVQTVLMTEHWFTLVNNYSCIRRGYRFDFPVLLFNYILYTGPASRRIFQKEMAQSEK
jgi:hypothetical protein